MEKFIYIITCEPIDGQESLDLSEVQRFGHMLNIAVSGAASDCLLRAGMDMIPVGLPG